MPLNLNLNYMLFYTQQPLFNCNNNINVENEYKKTPY